LTLGLGIVSGVVFVRPRLAELGFGLTLQGVDLVTTIVLDVM
jgi:hypothetical protein